MIYRLPTVLEELESDFRDLLSKKRSGLPIEHDVVWDLLNKMRNHIHRTAHQLDKIQGLLSALNLKEQDNDQ